MSDTVGSVMDDIVSGLARRSGMAGVNIFSGPVPMELAGTKCVVFGDARLREEQFAMGGSRMETWDVEGEVFTIAAPWQGTIETTIKAARDEALELLSEIQDYIAETYVGTMPDVEITAGQITQSYTEEARLCWASFTLTIKIVS